jgi:uncharacterized protein
VLVRFSRSRSGGRYTPFCPAGTVDPPRGTAAPPRSRRPAVGLDLAGSPLRRTGFCRLGPGLVSRTRVLGDDEEIVRVVVDTDPSIVAIDAPLALPRGRRSLDVPGPPHLRACDRELLALGIRFFPLTLGPMRQLTARGIALAARLRKRGFTVIEAYPGGAQDVLGLPRKGEGVERLRRALVRFGFRGDVRRPDLTHDELDAIACAYTGREHLAGRSLVLGVADEAELVLPRPRRPPRPSAARRRRR